MKELEAAWKRQRDLGNHFECSGPIDPLATKRTQMLLITECRAQQARAAYLIQTHRRKCSLCGEKKPIGVSG
jgi:hypothetical protein